MKWMNAGCLSLIIVSAISFVCAHGVQVESVSASACQDAQATVRQFLALDADRARQPFSLLAEVYSDTEGPGWDSVVVIEDALVGPCSTVLADKKKDSLPHLQVGVTYHTLGVLGSEEGSGLPAFLLKRGTEIHTFEVISVPPRWKIAGVGEIPPHVSVQTALQQLDTLEQHSDADSTRAAILKAKEALRSALPSP